MLYSKETNDKYKAFTDDIAQLDTLHKDDLPEGATVKKTVVFFNNGHTVTFNVSDHFGKIPQHIKDKMVAVFEKHYKPKQMP